jgi:hypothetical protein
MKQNAAEMQPSPIILDLPDNPWHDRGSASKIQISGAKGATEFFHPDEITKV